MCPIGCMLKVSSIFMMTKRNFIALAEALNGAFPISENVTPIEAWRNTVVAVAEVLQADNRNFDHRKFIAKVIGDINAPEEVG